MSISLDEVNYLIIKYLKESGFTHTAYIFETESFSRNSVMFHPQLPPSSLVMLLQKSLDYLKYEKRIKTATMSEDSEFLLALQEFENRFEEKETNIDTKFENAVLKDNEAKYNIIAVLRAHSQPVYCCHWSPDGKNLLTASNDSTLIMWDFNTVVPIEKNRLLFPDLQNDSDKCITSIDWTTSGSLIAIGSFDNNVTLFDRNGSFLARLRGHTGTVFCVRFSRNGKFLASCSADSSIIIWNVETKKREHLFMVHKEAVVDLAWGNDFTIATASGDGLVSLCMTDGTFKTLSGHKKQVTSVSWSTNNRFLATAGGDGSLIVWEDTYRPVHLQGHDDYVSCIKWFPNSQDLLVSASSDCTIRVWSVEQQKLIKTITQHQAELITIDISPKGDMIASGDSSGVVLLTNVTNWSTIQCYKGSGEVYDIKWSPNGKLFASCLQDSVVSIISI